VIDTALYDIRLYKKNKFQIPGTIISSLISPLIDIIGYFYLFCTACIFSGIGKKIISIIIMVQTDFSIKYFPI